MKNILKYAIPIKLRSETEIKIHEGFIPLDVQEQDGKFVLWAVIDESHPLVTRKFVLLGTGLGIPDGLMDNFHHIKTIQSGPDVWHIFMEDYTW